jgi:hypothetical protein
MAAMTVEDYTARMLHAIGNAQPATGVTTISILNEALFFLFDYHDWSWRQRPPALLNIVSGQDYVALPTDFGWDGMLKVHANVTVPQIGVLKCTLDDISRFRGQTAPATTPYYVALAWPTQTSLTVAPATPRLEIWPTPSLSISNAIRITYRAGAISVTNTTDVPNIPTHFEGALSKLACGLIKRYELDGDDTDYVAALGRLEQLKLADAVIRRPFITEGAKQ